MLDKMGSEEHSSKWSALPKKEYTQAAYLEGDAIMQYFSFIREHL